MVRSAVFVLSIVWVGVLLSSVADGQEVRGNAFHRRKSSPPTGPPDVSGPFPTYRGTATMEGLSQFFRWWLVTEWNGTRTDEQHTSFVPPCIRPYVFRRPQMQGCIKCLRVQGGLAYWVTYGRGGRPYFTFPERITRDVIRGLGKSNRPHDRRDVCLS
jgi:hypothetical protein